MSTKRDYYEILGVDRAADADAVKRAYRKLALKHHPDKDKSADAEERFKELSEAYAVLSDPQKRQLYDQYGHAGVDQRYSQEDIFRTVNLEDIFGDLSSVFENFFGGFGRTRSRRDERQGRDLSLTIEVGLVDVRHGATKELEVRKPVACPDCQATGAANGGRAATCPQCRGHGQVQRLQRSMFGQIVQVMACDQCRGEGIIIDKPCTACRGAGRVEAPASIKVNIPPGIDETTRLRLGAQGEAGVRGAAAGDLYVRVRTRQDERFERNGADLHTMLPVRYAQAALGDKVTVEDFESQPIEVMIPAGTHHGQRLRLRGQGLPSMRGGTGDLYVHIHLEVPAKLSKEAQERLRAFDESLQDGSSKTAKAFSTLFGRKKD